MRAITAPVLPLAVLLAAAPLGAQRVSWTGAAGASTGRYVLAERSTTGYLSSGIAMEAGRLELAGSLAVVGQSTPWVTASGVGPLATGGPQHGALADSLGTGGRRRRGGSSVALADTGSYATMGVGDALLSGRVRLSDGGGALPVTSLSVHAKAPLASADDGLGTGEWDYAVAAGAAWTVGRNVLAVDGAWWWIGDMPALTLRDVPTWSVAVGRLSASGRWSAYLSAAGAGAAVEGTDAPAQLGATLLREGEGRSIGLGVSAGLSESSPDVAVTLTWRVGRPSRRGR